MENHYKKKGMALLLIVVIIGAASFIIALNIVLLGLGELDQGYTAQKGSEAFSAADGCIEESLQRLRYNAAFAGDTLNLANGNCIIEVQANGNERVITTTSTVQQYTKKLQAAIIIEADNSITLQHWEEL